MEDVIFVGSSRTACAYRTAGVTSFQPAPGNLIERVLAERVRCRILAMTPDSVEALPAWLARELREARWPRLVIVPEVRTARDADRVPGFVRRMTARVAEAA